MASIKQKRFKTEPGMQAGREIYGIRFNNISHLSSKFKAINVPFKQDEIFCF